ncbi:unnamed protein product [Aureobasidium mustum]|uniref:Uncharacterized protein n=1 Tax=Aureobasidium mustum TaxID=2773714 RepID=A0A9N8JG87_9PEZI|nr:unnamed protein product [Aureobasidium mustum]
MSSILAKIGLTASATSFGFSQCRSSIASHQSLVRFFHSSQFWYGDNAANNAKNRERYANDPEYRNRMLQKQREWTRERRAKDTDFVANRRQSNLRWIAKKRPAHIQNYINDPEYRKSQKHNRRNSEAVVQRADLKRKANINNSYQKNALLHWILKATWQCRLFWETHEPLISEEPDGTPGICSSCNGVSTQRLWWRRKKVDEKSAEKMGDESSKQVLDCHNCFCDMDWEKALPLGYRGHVFGSGKRLREPD